MTTAEAEIPNPWLRGRLTPTNPEQTELAAAEQAEEEFFNAAFREARQSAYPGRYVHGPLAGQVGAILGETTQKLHIIGPDLTPEALMPYYYLSRAMQKKLANLPAWQYRAITRLRDERLQRFTTLAQEVSLPRLQSQTLPEGLLDIPPFCHQGEDWEYHKETQACFNACFRMVFAGITGHAPSERVVGEAIRQVYGDVLVDDEEYLKIFTTPDFKAAAHKTVKSVSFTGADLAFIGKATAAIKAARPQASVQCIVSLGSESTHYPDVWHTNILLAADEDTVVCHDPSLEAERRAAFKRLDKPDFARRWAVAHNRGHLIIAE